MTPACPICRFSPCEFYCYGWDSEYQTTNEKFSYYRCSECRAIFIQPAPVDKLTTIYPKNYYSYSSQGDLSLVQRVKRYLDGRLFRKIIRESGKSEMSILDVGGGDGSLLDLIKEQNPQVKRTSVVDIDTKAEDRAKRKGHQFYLSKIEEAALQEKFDLILMLNILEHVSDPQGVLLKAVQQLAPGGVLIVKTPNTATFERHLFRRLNWGGLHCPRHWILFEASTLKQLLRCCGLDEISIFYTQGAPQWTTTLLGILADLRLLSVTKKRPMYQHPLYNLTLALTAIFDCVRLPFSKTAQMFVVAKKGP